MDKDEQPYEEGKRAGAHPAVVLFGVIIGLWLLIVMFIPNPKRDKQGTVPENPEALPHAAEELDAAPIIFSVGADRARDECDQPHCASSGHRQPNCRLTEKTP